MIMRRYLTYNCTGIFSFEENNLKNIEIQYVCKGTLRNRGRYAGQPSKEDSLSARGELSEVVGFIEFFRKNNYQLHYEDVVIVYEYAEQCNFELAHEELKLLSSLNITIGISCYEIQNK